ncbi:P1 family peptidase [Allobranchiibius sp. CTAmp26]|uniref:P1 family peptidase n=1 Tax=Allobranchiibius sp. CTAmp26 TaxID=2815214 RepID=UPI001AA0E4CA|nr:P1 family peptidase [Allobranchiibius sp. CTAmp26]MBO1754777.1 P1 family peptidase [Allobranchiibius sp. CTAmp26]
MTLTSGPTNSIGDVRGVRVGHHQRVGDGWLTGTTCVLAPPGGATGGVDVRGGAPGTRETDLLDPRNVIERVHAVVFSGGSAFGLAAATGVMDALAEDGVGFRIGEPGQVVPIVPAAVVFDLLRGGDYRARPDAGFGRAAYADALADRDGPTSGGMGAGTGARVGGLKGGIGSASQLLPGGGVVAALVVANAFGSAVDQATGELYAARFGLPGEFDGLRPHPAPSDPGSDDAPGWPVADDVRPGRATTLAVIATDVTLTKAQCQKLAGIGHDGLARAVRPVHTMLDGDSIFALASGERAAPDASALHQLLEGAADCVTRAVGHAVLAADTVADMPSYRDVHCPAPQEDARG